MQDPKVKMSSASSEQKIKSGNISALPLNIISRPCEWIVYVSDCHSGHPRPPSCWSVSSPRKITSFNLLGIIYNWISEGQTPEGPWPDSHSSSPRDASLLRAKSRPSDSLFVTFSWLRPSSGEGGNLISHIRYSVALAFALLQLQHGGVRK